MATTGLNSLRSDADQPGVAAALPPRLPASSPRRSSAATLEPGDRLPSERWLCDELGVSRATVRRAVEELAADGLVEARGRGSFVRGDALVEPPNTLMSLSELGALARPRRDVPRAARARSAPPRSTRPTRSASPPAPSCSSSSGCACSTGCRSRSTSTACRCGSCPARRSSTSRRASLYDALEAPATRPRAPTTSWRRAPPARSEAELLGLAPDAPVLFATTVAIDEDGRVVDLGRTVYRADRYRFQATLMRRPQGEGGRGMRGWLAPSCRPRRRWPSRRAAGRRARTSPTNRRRDRRIGGQDRRLREARAGHAEGRVVGGLRRPARRGQGADASSSRRSTRT